MVASAGAETTLITSSAAARPFSLFSVAAGVAVLAAVARRPRETRGTGTASYPRPMRAARATPRPRAGPPPGGRVPAAALGQSARASVLSREIGPRLVPRPLADGVGWIWRAGGDSLTSRGVGMEIRGGGDEAERRDDEATARGT